MKPLNLHRGHETAQHRAWKALAVARLLAAGCLPVLAEHGGSDVVAQHQGWAVAFEFERSLRNVRRNLERDLAQGCHRVVVVCAHARLAAQVGALLRRHQLPGQSAPVLCQTIDAFLASPVEEFFPTLNR